jgi:hypothetical protein
MSLFINITIKQHVIAFADFFFLIFYAIPAIPQSLYLFLAVYLIRFERFHQNSHIKF